MESILKEFLGFIPIENKICPLEEKTTDRMSRRRPSKNNIATFVVKVDHTILTEDQIPLGGVDFQDLNCGSLDCGSCAYRESGFKISAPGCWTPCHHAVACEQGLS